MGKFFIISGDDDFSRKRHARETAAMLTACDDPENADNIEVIQGDLPEMKSEMLADRFLESLRTPPFLSADKVVWMRHHPDLDEWTKENVSAVVAELLNFLQSGIPDDISVIIDGPGVDKRKTLFKNLQKSGAQIDVFNVTRVSDRNFAESRRQVLEKFAKTSGKRLRPDAMQYLTDIIGGDSGVLANELFKLACYSGDAPEITIDDCRAIVSKTQEAVIWEYTEAIQNHQCEKALHNLSLLYAGNESGMEMRLIAMLSNAYQKVLSTRQAMCELGITRLSPAAFERLPDDVKAKYPANPLIKLHPFRAFKMCEAAVKIDAGDLSDKLTLIRDTNRAIVSGGGDPRILLEQLTVKLAVSR